MGMQAVCFVSFVFALRGVFASSLYDIEHENYPISEFWRCQGVPNLQIQRVGYVEEAAKKFYLAKLAGRDVVDRSLEDWMPPASILSDDRYAEMLLQVRS